MAINQQTIAVVIPCYRVKSHILELLNRISLFVDLIILVDDECPEKTADYVEENFSDSRLVIIKHIKNLGVGGAVMTGYSEAIKRNIDIIVKLDGDGQMDPEEIPNLVAPIVNSDADYTKGNRFYDIEKVSEMPIVRLVGNAVLSLLSKISTGYWDIFDPTNGYTAISKNAVKELPFSKISQRYFFETDILFRLNTFRAVVIDVPMFAKYGNETSNLKIHKIITEFAYKHLRNFCKRIFYNYYLRDMSPASIELPLGVVLLTAGVTFGVYNWYSSVTTNIQTSAGTVMFAALPILVGLQLILSFINYDVNSVPRYPRKKTKLN